jgi:hypothetical protein
MKLIYGEYMEYKNFLESNDNPEQWAYDRVQGLYYRVSGRLVASSAEVEIVDEVLSEPYFGCSR